MFNVTDHFNGQICSGKANSFKYESCDDTKHSYQPRHVKPLDYQTNITEYS